MPTRRDLANAIRALSMDAVQRANSGHPGAPMGMADFAEVLSFVKTGFDMTVKFRTEPHAGRETRRAKPAAP